MSNRKDMRGDLLDELPDGGNGYERVSRVLRAARAAATEDESVSLHAALAEFASSPPGTRQALRRLWPTMTAGGSG